MNRISDFELSRSFFSDAKLSKTKNKITGLTQRDRKANLIEKFGRDRLKKEAESRGYKFGKGNLQYSIRNLNEIDSLSFYKKSDIPPSFYTDFKPTRKEFNELLKKYKIDVSKEMSLRELRRKLQKPTLVYNISIKDIDETIKEAVPNPKQSFSMVLSSLEIQFGDDKLDSYQEFEGTDTDKYKEYIKALLGDNRILYDSTGEVISEFPENSLKYLGAWQLKIFNYGGCSDRNGKIKFNDRENILTCYSFSSSYTSCFYRVVNKIHGTNYNFTKPIKLDKARKFLQDKGYDTKIYTMSDPFKIIRPNEIFYNEDHFYLTLSVDKIKKPIKKTAQEKEEIRNFLFFDIETIKDLNKPFEYTDEGKHKIGYCLRARLLAFTYCLDGDKNKWVKEHYYGYDCVDRFLEFLREHQAQRFNIYGFNSSRFDTYFIVARMDNLQDRKIKLIGKEIFTCKYYNHSFKDVCKLLPFSLDSLGKDFKTLTQKKTNCEDLGLTSYQLCELADDEIEGIAHPVSTTEYFDCYVDYCISDVDVLKEIFFKFREVIFSLDATLDIATIKTIGSLAKKYLDPEPRIKAKLEKFIDNDGIKNDFVRRSIYGGISYSIANRLEEPYRTNQPVSGLDINSQYPHSLLISQFPSGESRWTDNQAEIYKNFGFMEVSNIVFKDKGLNIIPYKNSSGVLSWWYHNKVSPMGDEKQIVNIQFFLNDAEIESYTFHRALISSNRISGAYAYEKKLKKLYGIKKQEDYNTKHDEENYNGCLRTTVKLILNSYYGKTIENYSKHKKIVWSEEGEMNILGQRYTTTKSDKVNNLATIGSIILSTSKRVIRDYMRCIPSEYDILAIETDGFYFHHIKYYQTNKEKEIFNEWSDGHKLWCKWFDYEETSLDRFTKNLEAHPDEDFKFNIKLGGLKLEKTTIEGLYSYFIGKKNYFLRTNEDYGDDNLIFDEKDNRFLKARISDMRMSGVPLYQYVSGQYQFLVHPSSYERMYGKEKVEYQWKKLARNLSNMTIGQIKQTRKRGYMD